MRFHTPLTLAVLALAAAAAHAAAPSFSEVPADHVIGAGDSQAGLIVDWFDHKSTPDYVLYDYKWSSTDPAPTAKVMLDAITAASGSSFAVHYYPTSLGPVVVGLG